VLFFRIVVSECLLLFEGACSINSDFLEYWHKNLEVKI
jgi:hypothetical protein